MGRLRHVAFVVFLCAAFFSTACGDPPEKEMQQAQGAIDAARAAGADRYAQDELAAAQDSLKKAQDAVAQRDYRLALNYALDSRERAQGAAKDAADHKAAARSDAEHALVAATAALNDAHAQLDAVKTPRIPAKTLARPRRTIADAEASLQKARALFKDGDYLGVTAMTPAITADLSAAVQALKAATPPPRRRR
jgi:hypothetical protein